MKKNRLKQKKLCLGAKERLAMSAKIHSFGVFSFQKILFWGSCYLHYCLKDLYIFLSHFLASTFSEVLSFRNVTGCFLWTIENWHELVSTNCFHTNQRLDANSVYRCGTWEVGMGCSMVMVSKVPLGRLNSQTSDFTIWHKVSQIRVLALVKYMYVLFKSFCHDTSLCQSSYWYTSYKTIHLC